MRGYAAPTGESELIAEIQSHQYPVSETRIDDMVRL
jgi:hypothetical protein